MTSYESHFDEKSKQSRRVACQPRKATKHMTLQSGHFPEIWKEAIVTPLLKKCGSDPSNFKNLRPVSNLSYISKLTESAVADQIQLHLAKNNLYPVFQSAYRKLHSTETALVKVQNDILINMNKRRVTLLVLLSGLHTANLSWQTRVGKVQKVDKLFPSHVKLVSNNKHGNLQHGRFFSAVALTYNSETEEKKGRNRKRWGIGKVGRNQVCPRAPPFCFACF